MRAYYRPPGSRVGFSASFGEIGFIGFLVFLGWFPFYVIFLGLAAAIWVVIGLVYLLIIGLASISKSRNGVAPTWKLHNDPILLDYWLDRNDIVKIPPRRLVNQERLDALSRITTGRKGA